MGPSLQFLTTDARILEMLRQGDEEALVTLYQSNRKPVTAFVLRNSGSLDDAEDMLQEALVVLWERVRSGRFQYTARLDTFVFATVKNMWMRRLFRKRREILDGNPPEDIPDGATSPLDDMITGEESRRVKEALDELGEPCRNLLLLFYWEELPMEEIAARLGFANAQTAKAKKYQCKKALQALMLERFFS
jgi:RNA polymerase sigma factor (sigma-70 family)